MTHDDLCPIGKSQAEAIALQGRHVDPYNWVCVCERLRAVEARKDDEWQRALNADVQYAAGIQAARDAVAATLHGDGSCTCTRCTCTRDRLGPLAAIEGLGKP